MMMEIEYFDVYSFIELQVAIGCKDFNSYFNFLQQLLKKTLFYVLATCLDDQWSKATELNSSLFLMFKTQYLMTLTMFHC